LNTGKYDVKLPRPSELKLARERFLATESFIQNDKAFWRYAFVFWDNCGNHDSRWREAFTRNGRMKISLEQRVRLFTSYRVYKDVPIGTVPTSIDDAVQVVRQINKSKADGLTVYRGFRARSGQSVRSSTTKGDAWILDDSSGKRIYNESWFKQDEGKGYSYSLSIITPTLFLQPLTTSVMATRYGGLFGDENILTLVHASPKKYPSSWKNYTDVHGTEWLKDAPMLGRYKVFEKNIVSITFNRGEEEIIALESKLEHYKPITVIDAVALSLTHNIQIYADTENANFNPSHGDEAKIYKDIKKWLNARIKEELKTVPKITSKNPKTTPTLSSIVLRQELLETWQEMSEIQRISLEYIRDLDSRDMMIFCEKSTIGKTKIRLSKKVVTSKLQKAVKPQEYEKWIERYSNSIRSAMNHGVSAFPQTNNT
jgi:hypothetical protein